jgi:hypothetical protein
MPRRWGVPHARCGAFAAPTPRRWGVPHARCGAFAASAPRRWGVPHARSGALTAPAPPAQSGADARPLCTPPRQGPRPWTPKPAAASADGGIAACLPPRSGSCVPHSARAARQPLQSVPANSFLCDETGWGCRGAGTATPALGAEGHAPLGVSPGKAAELGGSRAGPPWRGRGGKCPHRGAHRVGGSGTGHGPGELTLWRGRGGKRPHRGAHRADGSGTGHGPGAAGGGGAGSRRLP